MKRLVLMLGVGSLLISAVALSGQADSADSTADTSAKFVAEQGELNPWSNLEFNDESDAFQFVIVTDRTGGHRAEIFSKAVQQINLLQPEFVLSVGDLIEGYTTDQGQLTKEWDEFEGFVNQLEMPFFYVPGNHDITNETMARLWDTKFGRPYYHFIYKDVLFLCLSTEDPPGSGDGRMSEEQVAWVGKVLAENPEPRWTIVAMHKPLWAYGDLNTNGWLKVEEHLAGRNYTVFAGHVHRYQKYLRNGMNYYMLATTGGGSRLRGVDYGEFDHIVWATMKDDGPRLANIMLDGILPENLRVADTGEPGVARRMLPAEPVFGTVMLRGMPIAGANVVFYRLDPNQAGRAQRTGDAKTHEDGSYALSTYGRFDGAPTGEYVVVVTPSNGFPGEPAMPTAIEIPDKYRNPETSPLRVTVAEGDNAIDLQLE